MDENYYFLLVRLEEVAQSGNGNVSSFTFYANLNISSTPPVRVLWCGVWYVVCGRKSRNGIKMSNDDEQSVVGG